MLNLTKIIATTALLVIGSNAFAAQDCYCRYQTGRTWPNGGTIVKDFGKIGEVSGMRKERDCSDKCKSVAINDTKSQAIANLACSKGVANGSDVNAISKAGAVANGGIDHFIGKLTNQGAVYNCPQGGNLSGANCILTVAAKATCPKDYWLESHKQPFQCVKQACAQGSMPGVPAWLAIGGAVNGGKYLTDDKGGSRFFINASYSCDNGFSLSGQNCVKTYSATQVSPAVCKFQ